MEEDAVLSAGLGVMDQLIRGEYDEVYEELRSDVRDATTASALEDVMDTATDGLGEPKEVTDTMVTGVTDTDEPHPSRSSGESTRKRASISASPLTPICS